MKVETYLSFEGRAAEAIEFYTKALGARVEMMMQFKDAPEPCPGHTPPPTAIMHASLMIGGSRVMMTDGNCGGKSNFSGISLALAARDDAETTTLFNALADGGQVTMPLGKTFFASSFGMVTDQFGVSWMVLTGE